MRLSEFILANMDAIVSEWETFARSLVPPGSMDVAELSDHSRQMLLVIAGDLETPQTSTERSQKAKGRSDAGDSADTPAQAHGTGRAGSGFDMAQMVSEYRALRASVIRLWTEEQGRLDAADIADLIRFSEAVDQALAESTDRFAVELDRTKEIFLGILGHDLRTPLGAIVTSAHFILETSDPTIAEKMARVVVSSGTRMGLMIDDLLDFTRGRLGTSIPLDRVVVDLGTILTASVGEFRASRPGAEVRLDLSGDLRMEGDGGRLSQVWSNLLGNAIDHGSPHAPVTVTARRKGEHIVCLVHNEGPSIPADRIQTIFNPLVTTAPDAGRGDHLGLGLYIAQQIVEAHQGTIAVESSEGHGTTFTVELAAAA